MYMIVSILLPSRDSKGYAPHRKTSLVVRWCENLELEQTGKYHIMCVVVKRFYKPLNNEQQKFTNAEIVNSVNDGNKLNVNETDLPYSTDDGQNYNGLDNGINYAQYQDYNHIPVPKDYTSSYEDYGYSFLPPEKWYPQPPNPPICVSDKTCPVCPVFTTGTNIELKQWDSAQEILQPDHINVKYIQDKLNKGTS